MCKVEYLEDELSRERIEASAAQECVEKQGALLQAAAEAENTLKEQIEAFAPAKDAMGSRK